MQNIRPSSQAREHGFALVVVLLMVFLILSLLIALMTSTVIETRISRNRIKMSRARSYAMQGVQVAMWRLHDVGGIDQRVTATAALLDSNPDTPEPDGVQNPWLTGIWKGRNMTPEQRKKPITWLTSGAVVDEQQLSDERTVSQNSSTSPTDSKKEPVTHLTKLPDPGPDADTVWMLRKQVGEDPKLSVKARKIDITRLMPFRSAEKDKPYLVGHYAWWAADEGVKARANLPLPEFHPDSPTQVDDSATIAQWRLAAPQRGMRLMPDFDSMPDDQKALHKVLTFAQVPLLGSGRSLETALAKHWHDVTADSLGLITNGRTGGMKRDLSLFCEMDDKERQKYAGSLASSFAAVVDFYRASRRVKNATTTPTMESTPFAFAPANDSKQALASSAQAFMNSVVAGGQQRPAKCAFAPVMIRLAHAFSVQTQGVAPSGAGAPDQKLALAIEPVVTLWNPYNIEITLDAWQIESWLPSMHVVIEKRDPWQQTKAYQNNEEVWHDGILYRATMPSLGTTPGGDEDPPVWTPQTRTWSLATDVTMEMLLGNHASQDANGRLMPPRLVLTNGDDAPIRLKPGQIITGTLSSDTVTRLSTGPVTAPLAAGWKTTGGLAFDRLANPSLPRPLTPGLQTRVHNGSEIRITLEPARDTSYSADPFLFVQSYAADGLQGLDASTQPMTSRESIGYRRSGDVYDWAPVRDGRGPEFSHRLRAYSGKDDAGKPLPGSSEPLIVGTDVTADKKRYLGVIEWRMKTDASDEAFPALVMGRFDPRAIDTTPPGSGYPATLPHWQITARRIQSADEILSGSPVPLENITSFPAMFEVPTAPLLSIGQLQHFPIQALVRHRPSATAHAIGNSWPNPWVPATAETSAGGRNDSILTGEDVSRRWNEVFFDEYFFSSITPRPGDETVNGRLGDYLHDTNARPLPNPRLRPYLQTGQHRSDLLTQLTKPLDTQTNSTPAFQRVAASLLVEGAFNINSTSVDAWIAVLGSLADAKLPVLDAGGGSINLTEAKGPKFPRLTLSNNSSNNATSPTRRLSEAQLKALAREIVVEVKKRGPFTSLSDFVNRRLADDETSLKGPIQAAIDRTDINTGFPSQLTRDQLDRAAALGKAEGMDWSFPVPDHCTGPLATAESGYLTQADVLQALAPHLASRSDTFKIRSYGDVIDAASGRLEARAWVEVIVQRLPDYVNYPNRDEKGKPEEPPYFDPAWEQTHLLHNTSNNVYGRRWRIVRIRWLSPEEV